MDLFFFIVPDILIMALLAVEIGLVGIGGGNVLLNVLTGLGYAIAAFMIVLGLKASCGKFISGVDSSQVLGMGDIKLISALAFYISPTSLMLTLVVSGTAALVITLPIQFFAKERRFISKKTRLASRHRRLYYYHTRLGYLLFTGLVA